MIKRMIGNIETLGDTLLFCIGSLHGNETAGYQGLKNVFALIEKNNIPIKGQFTAILGNKAAYQKNQRYLDGDLNRAWTQENIDKALVANDTSLSEFQELREILEIVQQLDIKKYKRAVFMDLHTTSSANGVFLVASIDLDHDLLESLESPIIYGLNEALGGTAIQYFKKLGFESFVFEGGTIGDDQAILNIEDAVWKVLTELKMVNADAIPTQVAQKSNLGELIKNNIPQNLHLSYIHHINAWQEYQTVPSLSNFNWVEKGDILAHDRNGAVKSPQSGYLLMPLYQSHGEDGYFIVND
jgi:succinylglutamate desuccinylase